MALKLKFENGYYWPDKKLERGYNRYIKAAPDMDVAIKYCKQKKLVVQAGGHCGVWPKRLAGIFENVYTFEPNQHNFKALMANINEENIYAARGILGAVNGTAGLHINEKNTGGHWAIEQGTIPRYSIDSLHLDSLDLIILDVEGSELPALIGASYSLKKHSPVIMLEDNGNYELKGGYKAEKLYKFLADNGYSHVDSARDDKIWIKK